MVLDVSKDRWREVLLSGAGKQTTIFDGQNLFSIQDSGDEYVRGKPASKEGRRSPILMMAMIRSAEGSGNRARQLRFSEGQPSMRNSGYSNQTLGQSHSSRTIRKANSTERS